MANDEIWNLKRTSDVVMAGGTFKLRGHMISDILIQSNPFFMETSRKFSPIFTLDASTLTLFSAKNHRVSIMRIAVLSVCLGGGQLKKSQKKV